jgi:hypothetical protein
MWFLSNGRRRRMVLVLRKEWIALRPKDGGALRDVLAMTGF